MKLTELAEGKSGFVNKIIGRGSYRKRMMELGFVSGTKITVIRKAPFSDPVEYDIMGSRVALRNSDAEGVEIEIEKSIRKNKNTTSENITVDNISKQNKNLLKEINIAIIGNPNSGKSTIYNSITGKRERVGNYSGVTIESVNQIIKHSGYNLNIVDLPGVYSLNCISDSEKLVRDYIINNQPDIIINVVDAGNLERNMYLTTDLIDMDVKVVMALNMYDEFEKTGKKLNFNELGKLIGIPIIPTVAKENIGILKIINTVVSVYENIDNTTRHIHINYDYFVEQSIKEIQKHLKVEQNIKLSRVISSRFLAIKLLEKDKGSDVFLQNCLNFEEIKNSKLTEINKIEKEYNNDSEAVITDLKYGFISGALRETLTQSALPTQERNKIFDRIFTHKYFGLPIFIFLIWLMFFTTFSLGKFPMSWIENGVALISNLLSNNMADGMLKDLLVEGVISGVGGVIVFLPNILILFFFIALMEGTGYMSRAVFILDKSMHKIGLHGKSFIPLVMGFGCNVPAIISTRILENRSERMITMLINPFISCNARLPVYLLFIGAFFPSTSATMLFLVYLTGVLLAIITAIILRKTIFKATETSYVMELPPFRVPSVLSMLTYMWERAKEYLKKIAGVILVASVIFWALSYFPTKNERTIKANEQIKIQVASYDSLLLKIDNNQKDSILQLKQNYVNATYSKIKSFQREDSYIGQFGHFIEPAIKPLGFDWRIGISILSGLTAKEIIVSTLSVLYQADDNDNHNAVNHTLISKIKEQKYIDGDKAGKPIFTPLIAFVFMIFVSIYFPCIGSIVAISKESGSWKWGAFAVVYTMTLAWILSFIIYQLGTFFGL